MPIKNTSDKKPATIEIFTLVGLFLLGCAYFLFLHFYQLAEVPGFHFDEAWSANFAQKINTTKSLVWSGQSPYTTPWSQTWAALIFSWTKASVFTYRASQIFFSILGAALLVFVLVQIREWRAAAFLPWVMCCLSGLIVNHRFAIEITGFHDFCFALLVLGLYLRCKTKHQYDAALVIMAAVVLGVTSHILFLAPVLGLYAILLWREVSFSRMDRLTILGLALILTPFFLSVCLQVPEKGKGAALVALGLGILLWTLSNRKIPHCILQRKALGEKIIVLLSLPFIANALFFADGHWSYALTHGGLAFPPRFVGASLVLLGAIAWKYRGAYSAELRFWVRWFFMTTLFLGLLMLKPAPRYYEISLLFLVILGAFSLSRMDWRQAIIVLPLLVCVSGVPLGIDYFLPAQQGVTAEREVRFLLFKDNSRDFLSKQSLVRYLGARGCGFAQVVSEDSRVIAALEFLRWNNWPLDPAKNCGNKKMQIARRAGFPQLPPHADAQLIADFYVWQVD